MDDHFRISNQEIQFQFGTVTIQEKRFSIQQWVQNVNIALIRFLFMRKAIKFTISLFT